MHEDTFKELALKDFEDANTLNIDSYPAILVSINGELRELARGYIAWEELNKILVKELKQ